MDCTIFNFDIYIYQWRAIRACKSLLCDEIDIDELDENYYLFRMKSEADPRRRPIFFVILENIVNLGRKVRNSYR